MANLFANMFGSGPAQPAAPQQQAAPAPATNQQGQPAQKQPQEPGFQKSENTDQPKVDQTTGNGQEADGTSPLDQFADLYKNDDKDKEGKDKESKSDDFFSYDPEKLTKTVQGLNFTSSEGFSELAGKALQGDTEAFGQVINAVAQQVYQKAAELSVGVANQASKASYSRAMSELPGSVRSASASESLSGLNPAYKNEALAPMVTLAKSQFEKKFPEASSKELAEMVNNYMSAAAKALGQTDDPTKRPTPNSNQQTKQEDFSSFFGFGDNQS